MRTSGLAGKPLGGECELDLNVRADFPKSRRRMSRNSSIPSSPKGSNRPMSAHGVRSIVTARRTATDVRRPSRLPVLRPVEQVRRRCVVNLPVRVDAQHTVAQTPRTHAYPLDLARHDARPVMRCG